MIMKEGESIYAIDGRRLGSEEQGRLFVYMIGDEERRIFVK